MGQWTHPCFNSLETYNHAVQCLHSIDEIICHQDSSGPETKRVSAALQRADRQLTVECEVDTELVSTRKDEAALLRLC